MPSSRGPFKPSSQLQRCSALRIALILLVRCSLLLVFRLRFNNLPTAYYDRILVMDAGRVAEFDTPLNLFDTKDSIFRSLCDEASLSRQDIVRIRTSVATMTGDSSS